MYMALASEDDAVSLQKDLDNLAAWEDKWKIQFHPQKCSVVRIIRNRTTKIHQSQLHGHILETETNSKYLGVTINNKLSWNNHIAKKANNSFTFLRRNLHISQQRIKTKAYTKLVRPQVEYVTAIWDPWTKKKILKLEMVQR